MKKSDVLAIMENCKRIVSNILTTDLKKKEKTKWEGIAAQIDTNLKIAAQLEEGSELLVAYGKEYKEMEAILKPLDVTPTAAVSPRQKVMEIIPEEKQKNSTKKSRESLLDKILKISAIVLILTILAAVVVFGVKHFIDDEPDKDEIVQIDPSYQPEAPLTIDTLDVNSYSDLLEYATKLQESIADPEITKDDIMYALRLANFENLSDKAVFQDRDEVVGSAYYLGQMAKDVDVNTLVQKDANSDIYLSDDEMLDILVCSTDLSLTADDFAEAKTAKGYDIYTVSQRCVAMLNSNEPTAFDYCKVFNELVARQALAFSVTEDCPISTRYVIAGMYTANRDRILELTAGQTLGPIYGDGTRIDGTHGFICVEELEAFMRINHGQGEFVGNENNALYTFIIDENITCYSQDDNRGRN